MAETLIRNREATRDLAAPDLEATSDSAALAKAALLRSRIYTLRRLSVRQEGEAVVLRGRVESFYHKQLAQELVRGVIDGVEVINSISVVYSRERSQSDCDW